MANGRDVTITYEQNGLNHPWTSVHQNATQICGRLYDVFLPPSDPTLVVQDMADTVAHLQALLGLAMTTTPNPTRLHRIGSGWSLSTAPIVSANSSDVWILSTFGMSLIWKMQPPQIDPAYQGPASGALYLVQGGRNIRDLNDTVEGDGQSLKTSGASNGQTIAGAISTSTHGSAFQYGSMPEFIVGIQLVTGPTTNVLLERASYPVVTAAFAAQLGARLIRDDDLFNAALVSFGSFGIVAALMVETVSIYLLQGQRIHVSVDNTFLQAMNTLNLSALPLNHPGETPWHFEVTFLASEFTSVSNPIQGHGYVQTFYKNLYPPGRQYNRPALPNGASPGASLLGVVGSLANLVGPDWFQGVLRNGLPLYPPATTPPAPPVYGTSGETFNGGINPTPGKAMSMEMGIPADQSGAVLQLMLGLPAIANYLGVISYRWVKQTSAMLGWAKFPLTATIEFNAAFNSDTTAFYQSVWAALTHAGIPFTLHWGQMNNFTPSIVRGMYGSAIDNWLACRNRLMTGTAQAVFSSDFLISAGLDISQNPPPTPPAP
jgi:hypothetical protein